MKTIIHPDEEYNKISSLCIETLDQYKLSELAAKRFNIDINPDSLYFIIDINMTYFKLQKSNPLIAQRFQEDFLNMKMSVIGKLLRKYADFDNLSDIYDETKDMINLFQSTKEEDYTNEVKRIFLLDNAGYFENLPKTNKEKILYLKGLKKEHHDRCDDIETTIHFFSTLDEDIKNLLLNTIGISIVAPRKIEFCLLKRLDMNFFLQMKDKGIITNDEDRKIWIIPNLMLFITRLLKRHYNQNKTITNEDVFFIMELLPLKDSSIKAIRKLDECFYHRIKMLENK